MIYSSQIIVFHVYRYINLALTINFDAKILQIFDIPPGQFSILLLSNICAIVSNNL